eukprot:7108574-Alexandrium_andersonii.AAC.1
MQPRHATPSHRQCTHKSGHCLTCLESHTCMCTASNDPHQISDTCSVHADATSNVLERPQAIDLPRRASLGSHRARNRPLAAGTPWRSTL